MNWTDVKDSKGFIIYGGGKWQVAQLSMADSMTFTLLQKAQAIAKAARFGGLTMPSGVYYTCILHPFQILDLKIADQIEWLRAQEKLKIVEKNSELFPQAVGIFENLVLYEDETLPLFENGGVGCDLPYTFGFLLNQNDSAVTYIKIVASTTYIDMSDSDKMLLKLTGQQIS